MHDLQIKLEGLAETLVMADTSDADAVAELTAALRAFAKLAEPTAPPPCAAAARAVATLLEQSADAAAWDAAGKLVTALQAVIRDGRAPVAAAFPALSYAELSPSPAVPAVPAAEVPPPPPPSPDREEQTESGGRDVAATPPVRDRDLSGKYLTFKLAGEEYGLEILKVQEIIKMMTITKVPCMPPCVCGVLNLRGKVIPVMDLRLKFDMPAAEHTDLTCIIVVQVTRGERNVTMGLVVDAVSEVVEVTASQIEPAPEFGMTVDTAFILGMAKIARAVVVLLDVDCMLSVGALPTLPQRAGSN